MISFGPDICTDYEEASRREWLETNGIGGFGSGTVAGANTRRYHGILTAATVPPLGRVTMLSKLEETLIVEGRRYELSANQFPGRIHPEGFKFLTSFRLNPFPVWTFSVAGVELEKRLFLVHGENAAVVRYVALTGAEDVFLELRPLLSFVDYHSLQHENDSFDFSYSCEDGVMEMRPVSNLPPIYFGHNAVDTFGSGVWYRNFEYAIETERGFDNREDLFQPFVLKYSLADDANLIVSTDRRTSNASDLEAAERGRRSELVKRAKADDDFHRQLVLAADQFIVRRGEGHTVIAGYPWFSDWGRDTMIALSGLTLCTNRPEIAKEVLTEYSKHISRGMIPNRFPDAGDQAEYNTVDATLWYFEAIRSYAEFTGEYEFVCDEFYEKLSDIIVWHLRGTRYGIRVDTDGLLCAGLEGQQLTWMDAKIGDVVITPRTGKAVEIQALWYNALRTMENFAERCAHDEDRNKFGAMADLAKLSFNALFWNEDSQCLYDVIENGNRDESIRPNQIFAVSLHHRMLDRERSRKIVAKVEDELLTPVGLRSLSPKDPRYVPVYIGSPFERDSGYHQGTVWGWLIGPFIEAYARAFPERKGRANELLDGFRRHISEAGVGQISEIFDAQPPHGPRGCPAQAWSVAEILRVGSRK